MIICITGPMAAGKNYVCSKFEQSGWNSLDADRQAHQAIAQATPEIIKAFSPEAQKAGISLLNEDGTLNRRALGSLIFPEPELLKKQEQIVYPFIIKNTMEFINSHSGSNIILNATVLYKIPELISLCSRIIYVDAPVPVRYFRARKRDSLPFKQILQRFKSQKNLLKKYKETGIPVTRVLNLKHGTDSKLKKLILQLTNSPE